jgi:hypothetical protein
MSGLSALFALLLVYGIYELQVKQIDAGSSIQVVVPSTFIPAGSLITEEMVAWKSLSRGALQEGMITDLSQVIAKETVVPLGEHEPILLWKLDKFHLLPAQDQATFQLPKDYILSLSNGIRAGDQVVIYASGSGGRSYRLFDHTITVASVKSASNIEIDDPEHSNLLSRARGDKERMYASRREANGSIDHININLSEEEWLTIDRLCKEQNYKLVIALTAITIEGVDS